MTPIIFRNQPRVAPKLLPTRHQLIDPFLSSIAERFEVPFSESTKVQAAASKEGTTTSAMPKFGVDVAEPWPISEA
jgi:hypothetical protein